MKPLLLLVVITLGACATLPRYQNISHSPIHFRMPEGWTYQQPHMLGVYEIRGSNSQHYFIPEKPVPIPEGHDMSSALVAWAHGLGLSGTSQTTSLTSSNQRTFKKITLQSPLNEMHYVIYGVRANPTEVWVIYPFRFPETPSFVSHPKGSLSSPQEIKQHDHFLARNLIIDP